MRVGLGGYVPGCVGGGLSGGKRVGENFGLGEQKFWWLRVKFLVAEGEIFLKIWQKKTKIGVVVNFVDN